jgi:hypothetical protein
MEPEEILTLAEQLGAPQSGAPSPAALRAAFSRLYYACYHVILKSLRAIGYDPKTTLERSRHGRAISNHILVQHWLARSQGLSQLKQLVDQLYTLRQRADYELDNDEDLNATNFKTQLSVAKKVIFKTMQAVSRDQRTLDAWRQDIDRYEQQAAQAKR